MSRLIIRENINGIDYYLEWSNISDSPVCNFLKLDDFKEFYKEEYGTRGIEDLKQNLVFSEKTDRPIFRNLEYVINNNRAGENEGKLTKQEIIDMYLIDNKQKFYKCIKEVVNKYSDKKTFVFGKIYELYDFEDITEAYFINECKEKNYVHDEFLSKYFREIDMIN